MEEINEYLKKGQDIIKKLNTYKYVYVVRGNESCDLDSVVSSIVYGYTIAKKYGPEEPVISVINVPAKEFSIKTELVYHLKTCGVDTDQIIFRSNVDLKKLHTQNKLKMILVDHHTLTSDDMDLSSSVIEVIDHRPKDPEWIWEDKVVKVSMNNVGSCATIIAKILIEMNETCVTPDIAALLLGPILVDTACLIPDAGIATVQDHQVAYQLEKICKVDRKTIFRNLQAIKNNITRLTPRQVLTKDLKLTCGIPIVGLPILAKDFLKSESAQKAVKLFSIDVEAEIIVIMGLAVNDIEFKRDMAVWSEKFPKYVNQLVDTLAASSDVDLDLEPTFEKEIKSDFVLLNIGNRRASRKIVLPIIREFARQNPPPLFN